MSKWETADLIPSQVMVKDTLMIGHGQGPGQGFGQSSGYVIGIVSFNRSGHRRAAGLYGRGEDLGSVPAVAELVH